MKIAFRALVLAFLVATPSLGQRTGFDNTGVPFIPSGAGWTAVANEAALPACEAGIKNDKFSATAEGSLWKCIEAPAGDFKHADFFEFTYTSRPQLERDWRAICAALDVPFSDECTLSYVRNGRCFRDHQGEDVPEWAACKARVREYAKDVLDADFAGLAVIGRRLLDDTATDEDASEPWENGS